VLALSGVWKRLSGLAQVQCTQYGMVFLDGPKGRAHQKAAGAAKRGDLRPSEYIVKLLAASVAIVVPRLS
jgi:hypothetical protein